jgi:hypothetical protein
VGGHRHAPAALFAGKNLPTCYRGGWVGPRVGLDGYEEERERERERVCVCRLGVLVRCILCTLTEVFPCFSLSCKANARV